PIVLAATGRKTEEAAAEAAAVTALIARGAGAVAKKSFGFAANPASCPVDLLSVIVECRPRQRAYNPVPFGAVRRPRSQQPSGGIPGSRLRPTHGRNLTISLPAPDPPNAILLSKPREASYSRRHERSYFWRQAAPNNPVLLSAQLSAITLEPSLVARGPRGVEDVLGRMMYYRGRPAAEFEDAGDNEESDADEEADAFLDVVADRGPQFTALRLGSDGNRFQLEAVLETVMKETTTLLRFLRTRKPQLYAVYCLATMAKEVLASGCCFLEPEDGAELLRCRLIQLFDKPGRQWRCPCFAFARFHSELIDQLGLTSAQLGLVSGQTLASLNQIPDARSCYKGYSAALSARQALPLCCFLATSSTKAFARRPPCRDYTARFRGLLPLAEAPPPHPGWRQMGRWRRGRASQLRPGWPHYERQFGRWRPRQGRPAMRLLWLRFYADAFGSQREIERHTPVRCSGLTLVITGHRHRAFALRCDGCWHPPALRLWRPILISEGDPTPLERLDSASSPSLTAIVYEIAASPTCLPDGHSGWWPTVPAVRREGRPRLLGSLARPVTSGPAALRALLAIPIELRALAKSNAAH
uniref:PI3K/PI4K domain-containing protein n=1 Tax=Macrostomum lignano TaxID=282301 RepID=A0A1I8FH85_9PLAT